MRAETKVFKYITELVTDLSSKPWMVKVKKVCCTILALTHYIMTNEIKTVTRCGFTLS